MPFPSTVGLIFDFFKSPFGLIYLEARVCGMRILGHGIGSAQIATDEMDGVDHQFLTHESASTWKMPTNSASNGLYVFMDADLVARYNLTHRQVFFMNWLFKWCREVQELFDSKASFTREDLQTLVETCKKDHENVVPYPPGSLTKSALKE